MISAIILAATLVSGLILAACGELTNIPSWMLIIAVAAWVVGLIYWAWDWATPALRRRGYVARERTRLQDIAAAARNEADAAATALSAAEGALATADADLAAADAAIHAATTATPPMPVTQVMLDTRATARVAQGVANATASGARVIAAETQRTANAAARAAAGPIAVPLTEDNWAWTIVLALVLAGGLLAGWAVFSRPADNAVAVTTPETEKTTADNKAVTTPEATVADDAPEPEPAAATVTDTEAGGDTYRFGGVNITVNDGGNVYLDHQPDNAPPATDKKQGGSGLKRTSPPKKTAPPATPTCDELLKQREAIDKQLEGMSCKE